MERRTCLSIFHFCGLFLGDAQVGKDVFSCAFTACAAGNRAAMRASLWVSEKCADAIRSLWREDVFEFAGLLLNFLLINNLKGLHEKSLGQTMATNHVGRTLASAFSEVNGFRTVFGSACALRMNHFVASVQD
jgi:hypothetical protein